MRLPPIEVDAASTLRPMLEPEYQSVMICPCCRAKLRRTAELCPNCGAEHLYGPTRVQSLLFTGFGLIALPMISTLLLRPSMLLVLFASIGAVLGFFVAQVRFGGDHWRKPACTKKL